MRNRNIFRHDNPDASPCRRKQTQPGKSGFRHSCPAGFCVYRRLVTKQVSEKPVTPVDDTRHRSYKTHACNKY